MKRFILLLLIGVALITLNSCVKVESQQTPKKEILSVYTENRMIGEHEYIFIYWKDNESKFSVVHNPDCEKCKRKRIKECDEFFNEFFLKLKEEKITDILEHYEKLMDEEERRLREENL